MLHHNPLTNEVGLIEMNPHYALVQHSDGKESTVSLRDLASAGDVLTLSIALKVWPTSELLLETLQTTNT